jgi:hypothetical protein
MTRIDSAGELMLQCMRLIDKPLFPHRITKSKAMRILTNSFLCMLFLFLAIEGRAQQIVDISYQPAIEKPAYAAGKGPVILVDEGHLNSHTAGGRYLVFSNLLSRDGYIVRPSKSKFTKETLKTAKILVIGNAVGPSNKENAAPPYDPAFTDEEVALIRDWVTTQGGSLMLIVDHIPSPAANEKLARAFGIEFHNGFALEPDETGEELVFKNTDGSLRDHPITRGRYPKESIKSVATFTGSAFRLKTAGDPLLVFGQTAESYALTEGRQIRPNTPKIAVGGWLQGAVIRAGKGRVAVFGEAAMFSAQLTGLKKTPTGMNAPIASQNSQFLLNTVHWLSGLMGN